MLRLDDHRLPRTYRCGPFALLLRLILVPKLVDIIIAC